MKSAVLLLPILLFTIDGPLRDTPSRDGLERLYQRFAEPMPELPEELRGQVLVPAGVAEGLADHNALDLLDVARGAVHVHRENRGGLRRDRRLYARGVQIERAGRDVDELTGAAANA